MTTPQVTSEEIAKALEFLREVRAVCRKHGMQLSANAYQGMNVWPLEDGECELYATSIRLPNSDIDLNEG